MEFGSLLQVTENLINHVSAYIGNGMVFQNHPKRGEEIVPVSVFARGRPVKVRESGVADPLGFQSRLQAAIADPKPYNLFTNNCEHTVSWLRTGHATSGQLWFWGTVTIGTAVAVLASRK